MDMEKVKELQVLYTDLWENARPYFSVRRLEVQSKQVLRARAILDEVEEKKLEDNAYNTTLRIARMFGSAFSSDLRKKHTMDESIDETVNIIMNFAESYHEKECAECKSKDALKIAREAMKERRAYCEQWEHKYGHEWDNEDEYIQDAITNLEKQSACVKP